MRLLCQILIISTGVLLLESCASMSSLMSGVSSKQNQSAATTIEQPSKCDNWCHNGWCSTHCETNSNGEQY